jgi:hypothetical protein
MPERRGLKDEMLEPPRAIVCFYEGFNKALISQNTINVAAPKQGAPAAIQMQFF